ncbi:PREDICTED: cholecystokinin receptor type A isoform X2 [Sturnus vulgaris]|uniref:cholecystokinin receptor type A isoform X2 n=1 Tax=Sturnus vulgaris TaxID=9172 RepID=UPI000719F38B|nr:PREDICTED: cholecystokinin receptor type A isoform X2 [Sturnus vulgaris]
MEIVDASSFLGNGTNITDFLCDIILENDTFFCVEDVPYPSKDLHQIIRILLYCLIFLLSILGNILVIMVLIRNKRMRTVTNTFLLSLAVSDLMLCLFCMPFTLIPNLLKDFIFGSAVCKTATYFMGVSVSVSTFNLVAISLERYSAICKPLQSRVWQTKSHALRVIAATWCVSFIIMTPYPIYSKLVPFTKYNNTTANMCRLLWPSDVIQQSWYTFLLLTLFLIPGIIMMIAYGLISLELYRGIKFDASQRKSSRALYMYRKKSEYLQRQIRGWRWMLPQQNQKKKENAIATAVCCEPQQNRESEKQQFFCQLNGQETCYPHADGDRGFVFHLLDSHLQRQCLASLRHGFCRPASLGGSHLLHPPAVLHFSLREPHHLLLHEQAFPHGLPGHLHLLRQGKAARNTGRGW